MVSQGHRVLGAINFLMSLPENRDGMQISKLVKILKSNPINWKTTTRDTTKWIRENLRIGRINGQTQHTVRGDVVV